MRNLQQYREHGRKKKQKKTQKTNAFGPPTGLVWFKIQLQTETEIKRT